MLIQTVTRRWRLGPAVSVPVLVALLLVALGARLWDSIPDKGAEARRLAREWSPKVR